MSRSTGDLVDQFQRYDNGTPEYEYVTQNARVCFTDIPLSSLYHHTKHYGKFAVGFRRSTVMEWGGCPVWYLPNHAEPGTLQGQAAVMIKGIRRTENLLDLLGKILESDVLANTDLRCRIGAQVVGPDELAGQVAFTKLAVMRIADFIKQLSSPNTDDHRFLFEREWRIVRGANIAGAPPAFRYLTETEKEELTQMNPRWGDPLKFPDGFVEDKPNIDTFRFFNGIPGQLTVAEAIDFVLVPDTEREEEVDGFIQENRELFGSALPEIRLYQ